MLSNHQKIQRDKERRIFDAFSFCKKMGKIQQIDGEENSYPDGVLMHDGQKIAIEQTDYYHYKGGNKSLFRRLNSMLSRLEDSLYKEGYRGCICIRLAKEAWKAKKISSCLLQEIKQFIDSVNSNSNNGKINSFEKTSSYIEKIKYCSSCSDSFIIKDCADNSEESDDPDDTYIEGINIYICENVNIQELESCIFRKDKILEKCKTLYDQHWLIISTEWGEHINFDMREYKPMATKFDRVFLMEDVKSFPEIKTIKK